MNNSIELKFTRRPSPLLNYLRFIFLRRPGLKPGHKLPEMKSVLPGVSADLKRLKRYIRACGLKETNTLPLLYPHVLASPLFMAMLSHKLFPVKLIGALHIRNHIVQYRPIKNNEVFDITVAIQEQRPVKQGFEFDFTIELNKKGELLWKSISTMMKKGRFGNTVEKSPRADIIQTLPDMATYRELYIPKSIGKKYAAITSDYNPIHISRLIARLFGFKRDIAHGMWASAQAMAVLPDLPIESPLRIDLAFKGPLFLNSPSAVMIKKLRKGYRFDYFCGDNPRPSLQGKVTSVSSREKP